MKFLQAIVILSAFMLVFAACKKTAEPIIIIAASEGAKLQLNGIAGTESGSSAANSVYVDFSTDKATTALRAGWDLGFYAGADFRVILNNTTSATAKGLTKNDLTQVGAADTVGLNKLAIGFDVTAYALVDNVQGDITKTVIAAVSSTDADNKVYIVNRGTGGGVAARDWYKIRILRRGNGYVLQYAKLAETTFKTLDITKDPDYHFQYASFDNGIVSVEPPKSQWDFVWSYMMFQTALSPTEMIPYASSDFITINYRNGVQVAEVLTASGGSYADFNDSKIASVSFASTVDAMGTKWRTASPTAGQSGVKTDRFYVLKDASGNVYKFKFMSFHGDDGGTRGKPEFEYKLVKKA